MPKPEADTQCYRVYLVYHPMTGESSYFTIEYNGFEDPNASGYRCLSISGIPL